MGVKNLPGLISLIRGFKSIALDTNIFVRALDDTTILGEKSAVLLHYIKKTNKKVYISTLVFEEFFVKVYKNQREKDTDYIIDFITFGGLAAIVDIDQEVALSAARIRARYKLKAPDAIYLACAISVDADSFITTDKKLPRKLGKLTVKVLS